ncbi:MAG: hypothetical protein ACYTXY_31695, partial [Nostoc sp.]
FIISAGLLVMYLVFSALTEMGQSYRGTTRGCSVVSAIAAPATNEAIAYSTQKVMRLLSDSSSLMLFFPAIGDALVVLTGV